MDLVVSEDNGEFPSTVLKSDQVYSNTIVYKFVVRAKSFIPQQNMV
jgi:hypothetical protein